MSDQDGKERVTGARRAVHLPPRGRDVTPAARTHTNWPPRPGHAPLQRRDALRTPAAGPPGRPAGVEGAGGRPEERRCENCGGPIHGRRIEARFCRSSCRVARHREQRHAVLLAELDRVELTLHDAMIEIQRLRQRIGRTG